MKKKTVKKEKVISLNEALFNFSKEVPKIERTGHGQVNGKPYAYATYDGIMTAIQPALTKNRLFVTQVTTVTHLTTTIGHADNITTISSTLPIPIVVNIQQLGAAVTYLRRYTLSTVLNLVVEDDTDSIKPQVGVEKAGEVVADAVEVTITYSEAAATAKKMLDSAEGAAKEAVKTRIQNSTKLSDSEKAWLLK